MVSDNIDQCLSMITTAKIPYVVHCQERFGWCILMAPQYLGLYFIDFRINAVFQVPGVIATFLWTGVKRIIVFFISAADILCTDYWY